MENRPKGRDTHVTGQADVHRRGEGLGTGPVGSGRGQNSAQGRNYTQQAPQRSSGRKGPLGIILALLVALGGGGGALSLFGGGGNEGSLSASNYQDQNQYQSTSYQQQLEQLQQLQQMQSQSQPSSSSQSPSSYYSSLFGDSSFFGGSSTSAWADDANTGELDTSVVSGARKKYTTIKGGGKDTVTVMVYMCGTDLESRSGMATSDIQEMTRAKIADNVNIIVYTGGCRGWKNSFVSSSSNQIYQVKEGGVSRLVEDAGNASMTDPETLSSFISFCDKYFPANRNELILWDHGGGSISGYGYDEKYKNSGSMSLSGISKALKASGVTFDFVGYDACLMATVENGLMLGDYADYMIASEETEPGIGWYYTDWITELSNNTSISTLDLGKMIVDDFVNACAQKCRGQKTTLSVVDLAELSKTVPGSLKSFAQDTSKMISKNEFKTVSDARSRAREFAQSSMIDQVDLVDFAQKMKTDAGEDLADSLLGAVKYNKTSSNMTNAYGLSIYFPYRKASKVDSAVNTYSNLGLDDSYAKCIQAFAGMEVAGQAAGGGSMSSNPYSYLSGYSQSGYGQSASQSGYGNSSNTYTTSGSDAITQLLNSLMSGGFGISGLDSSNTSFFGRSLSMDEMAEYIADNQFDPSNLVWSDNGSGKKVIRLSEDQWSLVQDLAFSVYYDDGEGYVDLGLDNVFSFDDEGNLIADTEGSWLAVNGQPVAYYFDSYQEYGDDYVINGHIPVLLNGEKAELKVVFDNEEPYGYIAGAVNVYDETVTGTVAKSYTELSEGDTLDFICDFYSYDGEYRDTYYIGEQMTVDGELQISNVMLKKERILPMYRFRDIYQQIYWTDVF